MKPKKQASRTVKAQAPNIYYPAFLNLEDKKAVVVGGGEIAERKILALLGTRAEVTIVSPVVTKRIEQETRKGTVKHIGRKYRKGDLRDAFLVIAATDCEDTNERVSRDAPCLVNVVDTPQLCNFIVPSTVRRGPLTVAISTSGVSPAFARSLRRDVEKIYGRELSDYLAALRKIRAQAMAAIPDSRKRTRLLKAVASENMLKLLKGKGCCEARKAAEDLLKKSLL
ncbi:MAG TPA: bifunctional precorrin-2 dehydrogenase/sirohydrochlorin ferrochelatase [Thermodesulfovibrionales bacterium]|nr:bifunctional precorrin-2 dehydrogenase/sirohydrochlorin ferrochelatase [Thermodesulfovibrionales bacterium]